MSTAAGSTGGAFGGSGCASGWVRNVASGCRLRRPGYPTGASLPAGPLLIGSPQLLPTRLHRASCDGPAHVST